MTLIRDVAQTAVGALPRSLWPLYAHWQLAAQSHARAAILVSDRRTVEEVASGLAQVRPEARVVALPGYDILPFDRATPDPRAFARVAEAAEALAHDAWDLCVVDVAALYWPLPAVTPAARLRVTAENEATLTAEDLTMRGYQRVAQVTSPGEYTQRGELLDVWSPLASAPVRIERFDVYVETIRRFDPVSQLTTDRIDEVVLGLCTLPPDEAIMEAVADGLQTAARRQESDAELLAQQLAYCRRGEPFAGHWYWRLQAAGRPLPALPWRVAIAPDDITQAQARLDEAIAAERQALVSEGVPAPPQPTATREWQRASIRIHQTDAPAPAALQALPAMFRQSPARALAELVAEARDAGRRVWLTGEPRDRIVAERFAKTYLEHAALVDAGRDPRATIAWLGVPVRGSWDVRDHGLRLLDVRPLMRARMQSNSQRMLRGLDLGDLEAGDHVVHRDYGIGRFAGLRRLAVDGPESEFVEVCYAGGDAVLVPVQQLHMLEPYRAGDVDAVQLDKLGADTWRKRRAKAKEEVVRMAGELTKLYAERERASRDPLPPPGELSAIVEATFPYDETPDQVRTLQEIDAELTQPAPMDRLVVGDVGYGKTEIAIRTATRFIEQGMQVAVLVPTTVLAEQHGRTFAQRFGDLPIRLGVLSRYTGRSQVRQLLADVRAGKIDVVIGTHRLLQPDVVFRRLGLLIVDEEHRFGVKHKEGLKAMRRSLDTLSLTATPIPRTLQMHLGGFRSISVIATPPRGRLAVSTQVMAYDEDIMREALLRERARGGQAFVLHNRIEDLASWAQHLEQLVPGVRVGVVHGKLRGAEAERVFLAFAERQIDVLLATTIIESGLDFPNANTLIVLDAHNHGLADLYQLRGRVGRSDRRAFAYLFYPPRKRLTQEAEARLEVLESFSTLGAGFQIAMRDLEIRGAGELLGKRQAGHIRAIGLGTFFQLVHEAVDELQGTTAPTLPDPEIQGDVTLTLSDTWIHDPGERLRVYQQLATITDGDRYHTYLGELTDRFGVSPQQDHEFLTVMQLRPRLLVLGVRTLRFAKQRASLFLDPATPLDPVSVATWAHARDDVQLGSDRLTLSLPDETVDARVARVVDVLDELSRDLLQ